MSVGARRPEGRPPSGIHLVAGARPNACSVARDAMPPREGVRGWARSDLLAEG